MKKIVVFNGSPRKNGYSAKLLEQVIDGAKSKGAEILICDLNEDGVKGCQGCGYCKSHTECITKDKMSPALEALRTADGLIVTRPVYWGAISGQTKLFLDRLYSFTAKDFSSKHPGKKFITIFAQGAGREDAYKHVADSLDGNLEMFGWEKIDRIFVTGTNMPDFEMKNELLEKAYLAGCKLGE